MTVKGKYPIVLWAQRENRVFVSIQLEDITEEQINVDDGKLSFRGKSKSEKYEIDLNFYGSIIPGETKQKKFGREYHFDLKKKDPGPFWPRLVEDKLKHQNIKIDFSRWKDEDDSDNDNDNANLEDMMQHMGTGGGAGAFDPGECEDSEDSDDEDITPPEEEDCAT